MAVVVPFEDHEIEVGTRYAYRYWLLEVQASCASLGLDYVRAFTDAGAGAGLQVQTMVFRLIRFVYTIKRGLSRMALT